MTPAQAAELLTLAAAFDRRTIGKTDAIAWADALNDLNPVDCAEAIRSHFRASTDYLMPAHVRAGVRAIRDERIRNADTSQFDPHDTNPDDVRAWLSARRARIETIGNGEAPQPEPAGAKRPVHELLTDTSNRLPPMPRALPQADVEKKRVAATTPPIGTAPAVSPVGGTVPEPDRSQK